MSKTAVENVTERFRQLVIASLRTDTVGPAAAACVEELNTLYAQDRRVFTVEDARWLNVLQGILGQRLAAHRPHELFKLRAKRKGDSRAHCWRCETPVDERFTETCGTCSTKAYQWRRCPVCQACGCQRSGQVLL